METKVQEKAVPERESYIDVRAFQLKLISRATFSEGFIAWLTNKMFDYFSAYLKSRGDTVGIKLLDYLTMLYSLRERYKRGAVDGMTDEQLVEIVGSITHFIDFDDLIELRG